MIGQTLALLRHDARLQYRNGIYLAYGFVLAFYLVMLWQLGPFIPDWAIAIIIYTDPSVLGFFFVGALMMLEKAEGTRMALAITPVSAQAYFRSKALTLTAFALLAILILAFFVPKAPNIALLLAASAFTSVQFLGLGVWAGRRYKTVTSYLVLSAGWVIPIILPAGLALLPDVPLPALFWPPAAQLSLTLQAVGAVEHTATETVILLVISAIGAMVGAIIGVNAMKQEFGRA